MNPEDNDQMEIDQAETLIRERVKSEWRNCRDLDDFMRLAQIPEEKKFILSHVFRHYHKLSFQEAVVKVAHRYLWDVQTMFREKRRTGVRQIPPSPEGWENEIVSLYPDLLKINEFHVLVMIDEYHQLLVALIPDQSSRPPAAQTQLAAMKSAFHQAGQQRDITSQIYKQICDNFNDYSAGDYLAPFTSIIGPSGIGKSSLVKQLAYKGHAYVVYSCLAPEESRAYPERSIIANAIQGFNDREDMTTFFECHIAASLVNVEICKSMGITPAGFYELQVLDKFVQFQKALGHHLWQLYTNARETISSKGPPGGLPGKRGERSHEQEEPPFDYQHYVNRHLTEYESEVKRWFQEVTNILPIHHLTGGRISLGDAYDEPLAIICFDEVRMLFSTVDNEPQMKYLALRRAMRHRAKVTRTKEDTRKFFGLLLDTTSRGSDLSPPREIDPSLKYLEQERLFPPIYKIDTMDIFTEGGERQYDPNDLLVGDQTALKHLFSFGRPLWGAILNAGQALDKRLHVVSDVARTKIYGVPKGSKGPVNEQQALALITYRMNFYIALYSLAESLVSGHLRYIVGINLERTLLRTPQPSEPLLAHLSAHDTLVDPKRRVSAIKALYENTRKGFINLGDAGEAVAALILMFSFDRALDVSRPRPVQLRVFLSTLLPPEILDGVRGCVNDDWRMGKLWEYGYVFFNHFVRVTGRPDKEMLRRAYGRCAAIFPPHGHTGCDIIIPVGVTGQTPSMSYLLIQVKNRKDATLTRLLRNEADSSLRTAANSENLFDAEAYMGILMSLRGKAGQHAIDIVHPRRRDINRETRQSTMTPDVTQGYNWDHSKRRIIIASVGLSLGMYPGLTFSDTGSNVREANETIDYLNRLLGQTSEIAWEDDDIYYKRLAALG